MIIKEKLKRIESRIEELIKDKEYSIELSLLCSEALELNHILSLQKDASIDILDMLIEKGLITIKEKENIGIKWDSIDPKKMEVIKDE